MRRLDRSAALAAGALLLSANGAAAASAPAWAGYAGNAQHTAAAPAVTQPVNHVKWSTPVDLDPQYSGDELLIHYGSPMITAANTVLVPQKTTAAGNWRIQALHGTTGKSVWTLASDYVLPPDTDWTPAYPAALGPNHRLFFAGAGGTVQYRAAPDNASGKTGRLVFYGLANFNKHIAQLTQTVMVDTPITSDSAGNIYFGFVVTGSNPLHLVSGIARISADGKGSWVSATKAAGDSSITQVAMNCAPAISADGQAIYIAVSNGSGGYLVKLNAATLATEGKQLLVDPASKSDAWITDISSASPTIGPDGDVYYGVLENPFTTNRGWLLHFDANLTTLKTPGSFGWDDTVSVVPASAIPSYKGSSTYLLMTKYNSYLGLGGGTGQNKIAILDPNAMQLDEYISTPVEVMLEVQTVLGPTPNPNGGVYEWCINSAAVDTASGAVIAGSEDGHVYRWNLASNTLSVGLLLNPPQPEAYTPSLAGPNGMVYSINNATLYAIGK